MQISGRTVWAESKRWIEDTLGIAGDQVHVHIGLAMFLIAAVILRRRKRGLLLAWLIVFFLQGFNEALDAWVWLNWTGTVNWAESARDFAATLFWPSVLCLLGRRVFVARMGR